MQHIQQHGLSQRRASGLIRCNRHTAHHISCRIDDSPLRTRLRELATDNPAFGYRMLYGMMRLEGWAVNHKKVYRLYRDEGLQLLHKGRKRLKSEGRGLPQAAMAPNAEWALDFVHDSLCDGRPFRTLNIIDAFSRDCLAVEAKPT